VLYNGITIESVGYDELDIITVISLNFLRNSLIISNSAHSSSVIT